MLEQIDQYILKNQFTETIHILKKLVPEFSIDNKTQVEK